MVFGWPYNCANPDLNRMPGDDHMCWRTLQTVLHENRYEIRRLCWNMIAQDLETYALVPRQLIDIHRFFNEAPPPPLATDFHMIEAHMGLNARSWPPPSSIVSASNARC